MRNACYNANKYFFTFCIVWNICAFFLFIKKIGFETESIKYKGTT